MEKSLEQLFNKDRLIHFIGIGGVGMSAIARILHNQGYIISGSDQKESLNTIKLKEEGLKVFIGHKEENIRNAHTIVISSAISSNNPELISATDNNLPIVIRAKALGFLMSQFKKSFAFAGTHGKTTTSSMAAYLFSEAKQSPTFLIGGEVTNLQTNARLGESEFFFAEADESDGSIQYLDTNNLVITNLEEDHLDHFSDMEEIIDLFLGCLQRLSLQENHTLFINPDQWGNKLLLEKAKDLNLNICTFGLAQTNQLYGKDIEHNSEGSSFSVYQNGSLMGRISLALHGEHNILNALAIIAIALNNGIDFNHIEVAIRKFEGAKRRFHLTGIQNNISIYDDYAHHPSEIRATLKATKEAYPNKKIIVAFQPHRYSRTMFFAKEFAKALDLADIAIVTNIYSAGEAPVKDISGETITKYNDKLVYIAKKEEIPVYAEEKLNDGDIFITMGAGDIFNIGKELLNRLKQKSINETKDDQKIIRFA